MRRESISIGLACLLGAGLGAWAAIHISTLYSWSYWLWPVGAIFGGIVGYLAYDPKAVIRKAPAAWALAWRTTKFGAEFVPFFAAFLGKILLFFVALAGVGVLGIVSPAVLATGSEIHIGNIAAIDGLLFAFVSLNLGWFVMLPLLFWTLSSAPDDTERHLARNLLIWNVYARVFRLRPRHVVRAVQVVWGGFVELLKLGGRFLKYLLIAIHSTERTICLVDASLGAVVGFWFGDPIIGAVAGGLFGVLNYEVVSVRWLKLAPRRT